MTTLEGLLQNVESHRLSALLNLACGFKVFVRTLASQPEIGTLMRAMVTAEAKKAVCDRALALAGTAGEANLEHTGDSALAAYLWLLDRTDRRLGVRAAERVAEVPGCWWARKVAEEVLSPGGLDSNTGMGSVPGVRTAP